MFFMAPLGTAVAGMLSQVFSVSNGGRMSHTTPDAVWTAPGSGVAPGASWA
jgi:hypothetical protein